MDKSDWLRILGVIVFFIFAIWLSKVIFEAVYYSDLPMWLKYLLLHG